VTASAAVRLRRARLDDLPARGELAPGWRIRTWSAGDEVTVPPLLGEAFGPSRATVAGLQAFWRRFPGIEPRGIFVVEDAGGRVATTATTRLDPNGGKRGWIHLVATRRDLRRRGLATFVVVHALHELAAAGARTAQVGTEARNEAALAFYRALGFTICDGA
jgi:ribosomal protein S18 acetylase RimI-like enzyme